MAGERPWEVTTAANRPDPHHGPWRAGVSGARTGV